MKACDHDRDAVTTGNVIMTAGNGTTGVIKAIHGEGKAAKQLHQVDCVEVDGCEDRSCPLNLVRLGFHQFLPPGHQ